jgi:hypothetical protein
LYGVLGIARRPQPPTGLGRERTVVGPDDLSKSVGVTRLEGSDQAPVVVRVERL